MSRRISRAALLVKINSVHEESSDHLCLNTYTFNANLLSLFVIWNWKRRRTVRVTLHHYSESPFRVHDRIQPFVHRVRISIYRRQEAIYTLSTTPLSPQRKAGPRVESKSEPISTIAPTLYIHPILANLGNRVVSETLRRKQSATYTPFCVLAIHSRSDNFIVSYTRCKLSDLGISTTLPSIWTVSESSISQIIRLISLYLLEALRKELARPKRTILLCLCFIARRRKNLGSVRRRTADQRHQCEQLLLPCIHSVPYIRSSVPERQLTPQSTVFHHILCPCPQIVIV
jgi:hypothetical protein